MPLIEQDGGMKWS